MLTPLTLLLLALPVACVAWTVTHEAIFEDVRNYVDNWEAAKPSSKLRQKLSYLVSCEYCFSHYVSLLTVVVTQVRLVYSGVLGNVLALFALVWVANFYTSLYLILRLTVKRKRAEAERAEALTQAIVS